MLCGHFFRRIPNFDILSCFRHENLKKDEGSLQASHLYSKQQQVGWVNTITVMVLGPSLTEHLTLNTKHQHVGWVNKNKITVMV